MKKNELGRLFKTVCEAFPSSNTALFDEQKSLIFLQENLTPSEIPWLSEPLTGTCVVESNRQSYLRLLYTMENGCLLVLFLNNTPDKNAEELFHMLEMLIKNILISERKKKAPRRERTAEERLLDNLFYSNSMESRIYASLLAAECRKNLELQRAVCILAVPDSNLTEKNASKAVEIIRGQKEASQEDIVGTVSENQIILLKTLKDPFLSIRCQCQKYFEQLLLALEKSTGLKFFIYVGTLAEHSEDYARSMKSAFETMMFKNTDRTERIIYVSDCLTDYTFFHSDPDRLRHFLEEPALLLAQNQELLRIAENLIKNDMSIITTAKETYLHRNTVSMQLGRIRELLKIDPAVRDSDRYFLMLVCAYCRKYLNIADS